MTDEPSQPLATSLGNLSSGFGALTGIEEARDAQVRNQTTLDKLIEVGEYVITKYISEFNAPKLVPYKSSEFQNQLYIKIYKEIKEQKLKEVEFTEKDLQQYLTK